MWRTLWYKNQNGDLCELWQEIDQVCNICLEEKCKYEIKTPTTQQQKHLGKWEVTWMKSCETCLNKLSNDNAPPFGRGESINETNIFF